MQILEENFCAKSIKFINKFSQKTLKSL